MDILVINGPNLNMLGVREPDIYGRETNEDLVALCERTGVELGCGRIEVFQSNHEGDLIDKIQEAYGTFDGIVINPAAYTHTSVGILDALKAVALPAVESHISAVDRREAFRHVSYTAPVCVAQLMGFGLTGYALAVEGLVALIQGGAR